MKGSASLPLTTFRMATQHAMNLEVHEHSRTRIHGEADLQPKRTLKLLKGRSLVRIMACEQTSSAASDHGRQEDSRRIDVMFLCDEWKSSKGRLSTFNREFPVNLAETTRDNINVHCYVAQSDEQSKEDDVIVLYT